MNNIPNAPIERIKIGLVICLLAILTGCAGIWSEGYYGESYYGEAVVVLPDPDMFLFGGGFERGRDVYNYSRRGGESRRGVHHRGGRPAVSHPTGKPGGR
jgi:hypothetical protein